MSLPRLIVLSGLPRSGKSSVSRYLADQHAFLHVSSDQIYLEYGAKNFAPSDPRWALTHQVVRLRAMAHLLMERDVVIDTTGMFRWQRDLFFDLNMYSHGGPVALQARKYLLSLEIDAQTWEQRQLAAGRSLEQKAFYQGKFEQVLPEELRGLEAHLKFNNNVTADFQWIKQSLSQILRVPQSQGNTT